MRKMSTGFAALLVAGLSGGACGGHSGLKSGQDGASAAGGATGGQAGGGVSSAIVGGSSTGGTVGGTGGTVADAPPSGQFPACPMLESLNSIDSARVSWDAGRFLLECAIAGGVTEDCLSNDAMGCTGPNQVAGAVIGCTNLCATDEYGLSFGGVGPVAPPPSIDLPAGCRSALSGPGGGMLTCCPCGEASARDAASSSEVGPSADTGADASLCPPGFVWEGDACPSPNLRCPGGGNPPPLCDNFGTCVCGADGIWAFIPSICD
jgi:hypothetical protein